MSDFITLQTDKAEVYSMKIFEVSRAEKLAGRKGIPVCAHGEAGIGKTELPKMLVRKYAEFFGGEVDRTHRNEKGELEPKLVREGNLVYVPLGQIEEKAELQGLPEISRITKKVAEGECTLGKVTEIDEDGDLSIVTYRTHYATPTWIPQVETHGEKGLLVIDDMNRADGRILNSIMQLLQDGELLGWKLPIGWEIHCTCNPDDGKYNVTPMDEAQIARMANFTQEFGIESWVQDWAIPTGIHPTAIDFAMSQPNSMVRGDRTNPRSFDKFFRLIPDLLEELRTSSSTISEDSDLAPILNQIKVFGEMNIDKEAVRDFLVHLRNGGAKLPTVQELLSDGYDIDKFLHDVVGEGLTQRVDIIAQLNIRIGYFIKSYQGNVPNNIQSNLNKWLVSKYLPSSLKWSLAEAVAAKAPKAITADIARDLFNRLKNRS